MIRIVAFSLIILFLPMAPLAQPNLTPDQLAQQVYDRNVGDDMQMLGTMKLISAKGHERVRTFITLRKDKPAERMQMIRFTSPADIDGTSFLTLENNHSDDTEQHLYLPALKRTRRIVASQKGRSFVNSDFTYEDMQRHPVDAWNYELLPDETYAGLNCYVLVSTPKETTETQYSKLISWIEKEHLIPLKTLFWDQKGRQAKRYTVKHFELIDGIATEMEVVMEDLLSGHKTVLTTEKIGYNSGLKDALFTTRALER